MNKEKKKTMDGNPSGFKIRDVVILGIVLMCLIVLVVKYQGGYVGTIVDSKQLNQTQDKIVLCKKTVESAFQSRADMLTLSANLLPDKKDLLIEENCTVLQEIVSDDKWDEAFIVVTSGSYITSGGRYDAMNIGPYYKAIAFEGEQIISDFVDYNLDGEKELVLMVPITNDDAVQGLLCGVINSEFFREEVKRFAEKGIYYYITDIDGQVFGEYCANQKEESGKVSNLFEQMKLYGKDSNSITQLQNEMEKGKTGIVTIDVEGTKKCFAYAPMAGTEMYLFMTFDESEVYEIGGIVNKNYDALLWNVIIVFAIFVGAVVLLYMLGNRRVEEHTDELKQLAEIDALTSAYNKAATVKYIKQYMDAMEPGEYCAMFIVDVDNFKMINDTKGHAFGDLVLKELGNGIRSEFRVTDIIGRIGGDEFVVFLKNVDNNEQFMRMQGEKLVNFFHDLRPGEYVKTKVSGSIGGAIFPTDATDYESLYKAADKALYLAKKRGKDQYALYQETLQEEENE